MTNPISFDHIVPNLIYVESFLFKDKKNEKTPQPHFSNVPFTVALGDPFVCVLLSPCIGWTVICCQVIWLVSGIDVF